ncbi:hypothetical protein ABZX30_36140 [Streptomyces sp. NPDC004542]|uniref:hypothetical protein n=1 Tax=Streptomyces sp. NPDC004542 TaxID=3154281 RepID=UPI0033A1C253
MTAEPAPAVGPAPVMRLIDNQRDHAPGLAATVRRLPSVLALTMRLAWHADRRALAGMLASQVTAAVLAALALTATTRLVAAALDASTAYGRSEPIGPVLHVAVKPAVWVAVALADTALADTAARAPAARLSPAVFREADLRVLDAAASV